MVHGVPTRKTRFCSFSPLSSPSFFLPSPIITWVKELFSFMLIWLLKVRYVVCTLLSNCLFSWVNTDVFCLRVCFLWIYSSLIQLKILLHFSKSSQFFIWMHQVIDEFHLLEEVLSRIVSASADLLHSGLVASTAATQLTSWDVPCPGHPFPSWLWSYCILFWFSRFLLGNWEPFWLLKLSIWAVVFLPPAPLETYKIFFSFFSMFWNFTMISIIICCPGPLDLAFEV